MKINEIVFSRLVEPTKDEANALSNGSEFVTTLAGFDLYKNYFPSAEIEVFFYIRDDEVIGYIKLQEKEHSNNNKHWWLLELWVKDDPEFRRKGLGSALVRFAKEQKERLILDNRMSHTAFDLVQKLIQNGNLQARILDLDTGEAIDYEYDNRGLIGDANKTFILEKYEVRSNYLQPIIYLDYIR